MITKRHSRKYLGLLLWKTHSDHIDITRPEVIENKSLESTNYSLFVRFMREEKYS